MFFLMGREKSQVRSKIIIWGEVGIGKVCRKMNNYRSVPQGSIFKKLLPRTPSKKLLMLRCVALQRFLFFLLLRLRDRQVAPARRETGRPLLAPRMPFGVDPFSPK